MSLRCNKATAITSQLSTPNNSQHSKHPSAFWSWPYAAPLSFGGHLWHIFPSGFLPITSGSRCRLRNRAVPGPGKEGKAGWQWGLRRHSRQKVPGGQGAPVSPSSGVGDTAPSTQK